MGRPATRLIVNLEVSLDRRGSYQVSAMIYDIPVKKITGEDTTLGEFKGKVLLMVNVASKCGLTPQYEGLEKLYEQFKGQGLVVAGFPANDFKARSRGPRRRFRAFCTTNYGVKFPMFGKVTVMGAEKHPLYAALIAAQPQAVSVSEVPLREKLGGGGSRCNPRAGTAWNFEKFLVSRDGGSGEAVCAGHAAGCAGAGGGD